MNKKPVWLTEFLKGTTTEASKEFNNDVMRWQISTGLDNAFQEIGNYEFNNDMSATATIAIHKLHSLFTSATIIKHATINDGTE